MNGIIRILLLIIGLSLFVTSCTDSTNQNFISYINYGKEGMIPCQEYIFDKFDSTFIKENDSSLSVFLTIRYNDETNIQNLPLKIEWPDDSDSIHDKEFIIPLFNKDDVLEGKGNYGIFENNYFLFNVIKPDDTFFISVSTTEKNTSGILALGILLEKDLR